MCAIQQSTVTSINTQRHFFCSNCWRTPCWTTPVVREWSFSSPRPALRARGFAVSGHKSAKEPLSWRATRYWIAACGATCTCLKCRRAVLTNVAAGGAQKRGYSLNRARASASNPCLTRDVLPNSLFGRGLLWPVEDRRSGLGNITCCSGVSMTVEALRQAQFH